MTKRPRACTQIEVETIHKMGQLIWVYIYFRTLHNKNLELFYSLILSNPTKYMPVAYTPTVGEACQKFGKMPLFTRGCYVCIEDRGNIVNVLKEYAARPAPPRTLVLATRTLNAKGHPRVTHYRCAEST